MICSTCRITRSFDFNHETAARLRAWQSSIPKSHCSLSPCRYNVSKPRPMLFNVAMHKGNCRKDSALYGEIPRSLRNITFRRRSKGQSYN